MTTIAVCGTSVGHYGRPLKIVGPRGLRFTREDGSPSITPKWLSCEGPNHDRITPEHHKRRFLASEGYWQRWTLGKRELRYALYQWDMMSLDMPPRTATRRHAQEQEEEHGR